MGKAHGKIVIDTDKKGADDAANALASLAAVAKSVDRSLKGLESELNKLTHDLEKVAAASAVADAGLGKLDSGFDKVGKSSKKSSKSLMDFDVDLGKVIQTAIKAKNAYEDMIGPLANFRDVLGSFRGIGSDLIDGNLGAKSFKRFAGQTVLLNFGLRALRDRLLGVNESMDKMPSWTHKFISFSGKIGAAAAVMGGLQATAGRLFGVLNKSSAFRFLEGKFFGAFDKLAGLAYNGQSKFAGLAKTVLRTTIGVEKLGKAGVVTTKLLSLVTNPMAQSLVGFAVVKNNLGKIFSMIGSLGKVPKAIVAGLYALPAAAQIAGKSLTFVSSVLAGTWSVVKQLSGGLLVIPSFFATIGFAVVPLMGIFKTLGSVMKDALKAETPEELAEAMAKVPEAFRPLTKSVVAARDVFKDLGKQMAEIFAGGLSEQIDKTIVNFKGPLTSGAMGLAHAYKGVKDNLFSFLNSKDTVAAFSTGMSTTRDTVTNLGRAFIPLLAGLRDIGVVGMQFIRDMSAGAESLTQKFANWANANKQNGNLRKWMDDAKQGMVDLINGSKNLVKALWSVLTLFASRGATENPLDAFAKSMEKLNKAVNASKADGVLGNIASSVKGIGTDKIEALVDTFKKLMKFRGVIASFLDAIQEISDVFVNSFIAALSLLLPTLTWVIEKLSMFAPLIGGVLGMAGAFKVLLIVMAPVRAMTVAVGGAFLALRGIMLGFAVYWTVFVTLIGTLGPAGAKVAAVLSTMMGALTAFGGVVLGVIAVVAAFWTAWTAGADQITDAQAAVDKATQDSIDNVKQLREAFAADKGLNGKTVFDQVKSDMEEMRQNLKDTADNTPGLMGEMVDAYRQGAEGQATPGSANRGATQATHGLGENKHSDEYNSLKEAGDKAEKAQKQLDALKLSSDDLAKAATGTDREFSILSNRLQLTGDKGDAAREVLQNYRDTFVQIRDASAAAGPGTFELAEAIDRLGEAGSSTADKLSALNAALKALGQDKTDETESMFAYAQTIEEIASATNLFNASGGLGEALLGDANGFDRTNDNAEILFENIKSLVSGFKTAAVNANSTRAAFEQMAPAIENLRVQSGLSEEKIKQLMSDHGGNAAVIDVLLQVKAGDDVGKALAQINAQILSNQSSGNFDVKLEVSKESVPGIIKTLTDAIPGAIATFDDKAGLLHVDLAPANPDDIKNASDAIIEGTQQALDSNPVQVPVKPAPQQATPEKQQQADQLRAAFPQQQAPPPAAVPDTSKLDDANNKIKTTSEALDQLNGKQVNIGGNIGEAAGQLGSLADAASKAATSFNTFAQGVQASMDQAIASINNAVAGINAALASAAGSANSYGVMVGNAFAMGLSSMQGVVAQAARNLAQAVNDNLKPGSPTKKGPLSGRGWVSFSGAKTGKAYAEALAGTAGQVNSAASGLAGGVARGMGPMDIGKGLGRLGELVQFGKKLADIFNKIGENLFKTLKFVSDPLGKGTLFGKQMGFGRDKSVSDEKLARDREDKLQEKLSSAVASGAKDEAKDQRAADAKTAQTNKEAADKQLNAAKTQDGAAKNVAAVSDEPRPVELQENVNKTLADRAAKAADKTSTKQDVDQKAIDLSAPENASQRKQGADLSNLSKEELAEIAANTNLTAKSQDEIISELRSQDSNLDSAIRVLKDGNASTEATIAAANTLDSTIQSQKDQDTPASRATAKSLESIQSSGTGDKGIARQANPIDTAAGIASDVGNIAGEVFTSIESVLESVGAAKDLGDTLVRGIENSEDVMKIIDNVQKFVETAANIASAVGSGLSAAGSIASAAGGGMDGGAAGAAIGGASQVASLISAGLSTVNGIIDLAQEAYRIAGKYVGDFLGMLVGGAGGALEGDVKFLLDQNDGTLKTYSKDNPEDKRVFGNPFDRRSNVVGQQPQIGQINVYGGPGQDPRDMTNEMMFAVAAAGSGAGNYN